MKPEHKRILIGIALFVWGGAIGFAAMAAIAARDLARVSARAHEVIADYEKRFAHGTLIMEYTETPGLALGPFNVKPAINGQPLGQIGPAWYIPAEVKPIYYGRDARVIYFLVDPQTLAISSGPHEPLRAAPAEPVR